MNDEAHCVMLFTSPTVDEPPRRGLTQQQQREDKQQPKSLSAGVGSSGQMSPSTSGVGDVMETSKTSSATFGDSNGDHDADEDGKESNNSTGASLDNGASSATAIGEKAKRLVVLPHHCGWEYLTKKKSKSTSSERQHHFHLFPPHKIVNPLLLSVVSIRVLRNSKFP